MATSRKSRKRRPIELTLSPRALAELRRRAKAHPRGTMSAVIDDFLLTTV